MSHRVSASVLGVALVASLTTVSFRAAALTAHTLEEVLARAAESTAAFADPRHRIACQESARQTIVLNPGPVPLDWSHSPTPWAYRDIVASWSLTAPSPQRSDGWHEVRNVESVGPFQPFPNKRVLEAGEQAAVDRAIDAPAPLPRFAPVFLSAVNQRHFAFSKAGEVEVQGLHVWEVKFRETATPLVWRLPISGSFWIDPSTGRVLRSAIAVKGEAPFSDAMRIDYRRDGATGFSLPDTLTRRTHVTSERSWVETTGAFTGCRVSPASAD